MTIAVSTLAAGQQLARAYWLQTDHIFAHSYPDETHCALCGMSGSSAHIRPTPEVKPTITAIIETKTMSGGRHFELEFSCAHGNLHTSSTRSGLPKIGSSYDCWECHSDWVDRNYPGLPESIKEQIETLIPKCPSCMQPIAYVPFVQHTTQTVYFDMDGRTGALDGESDHDDTLDEQPAWDELHGRDSDGWLTGKLTVECVNHHGFPTTNLAYRRHDNTNDWKIVA